MVALPKLNDTPQYSLVVPSLGKKVYYRPYLVKEEKVLLMASESEDPKHMFKSLIDTVDENHTRFRIGICGPHDTIPELAGLYGFVGAAAKLQFPCVVVLDRLHEGVGNQDRKVEHA